ncbi:MAG: SDR family NAD(P)-dependent oxidoreductase [Bacteroidales bacterium]|nr:SDR family NAD(P)-dependent oxidoreductase [Bacteroidales bacterium]
MDFKNQNVLITGGASGVGKIMGRISLEKGAKSLIIWDINQDNINKVASEFASLGKVYGYRVDVSNNDSILEAYAATKADCGDVDILIQCAGVVTSNATFDKNTVVDITKTMTINAIAPMLVANAILPDMIARNHGSVCNIASAAGMLSLPNMSVYAASKWSVVGWSDSVRIELQKAKSKVHFVTIAPYFINTGMFEGVHSWLFPILDPEKTSARIVKAIEKDRRFRGLPFSFHFIRLCQGLLPARVIDFVFGEVAGIYHAMDNFTGRK